MRQGGPLLRQRCLAGLAYLRSCASSLSLAGIGHCVRVHPNRVGKYICDPMCWTNHFHGGAIATRPIDSLTRSGNSDANNCTQHKSEHNLHIMRADAVDTRSIFSLIANRRKSGVWVFSFARYFRVASTASTGTWGNNPCNWNLCCQS